MSGIVWLVYCWRVLALRWDFEESVAETGLMSKTNIQPLLNERNQAHALVLRNSSLVNRANYAEVRRRVQRALRCMKNDWWIRLAEQIQGYAEAGNQQEFYSALKTAYGPSYKAPTPVRSSNSRVLISDESGILTRWSEYYRSILNQQNPIDLSVLDSLPPLPTMWVMDKPPSTQEVQSAIA